MKGKAAWIFVAVLALAVVAPGIVYAATGAFSSSSSTAAVTAKNSSSGRAINAVSNTGYTGVFTRSALSGSTPALYVIDKSNTSGSRAVYGYASGTGTGITYGVYGRANASGGRGVYGLAAKGSGVNFGVYGQTSSATDDASGVFGWSPAGTGLTNGVWGRSDSDDGAGVYGLANGARGIGVYGEGLVGSFGFGELGVFGASTGIGDGSLGIYSATDLGIGGHVFAGNYNQTGPIPGDFAGTCWILPGEQKHTCTYPHAFPTGTFPVIVLTSVGDPGGRFWLSNPEGVDWNEGFAVMVDHTTDFLLGFNYLVVGLNPDVVTSSGVKAASASKGRR